MERLYYLINCKEPAVTSLIGTVLLLLSILIIGFVVNKIEICQIRFLSNIFGYKASLFICNRITFPGIMLHELSHAAFATLFGAKVTRIKFISFKNDGRLGWVEYQTQGSKLSQSMQNAWASCAPTIIGLFVEYVMITAYQKGWVTGMASKSILLYCMISVADHMSMSGQDIKNYLRSIWSIFLVLYAALFMIQNI